MSATAPAPSRAVEAEVIALSKSLRGTSDAYHETYRGESGPEWPDLVGGDPVEPRPFAARLRQARIQTAAASPGLLRPLRVLRAALAHAAWSASSRARSASFAVLRAACSSAAGVWLTQAVTLALCWMLWHQRTRPYRLTRLYSQQIHSALYQRPRWPAADDAEGEG